MKSLFVEDDDDDVTDDKGACRPEMASRWREQYRLIEKMRESRDAPVDKCGAHCLADEALPGPVRHWQYLVGIMISSQTKDEITSAAVARLKSQLPGGLTIDSILATPEDEIDRLITPVGFHKRKASYLRKAAQTIKTKYHGDVPSTYKELVTLDGVGRKMATLYLSVALGQVSGIAVDTHVQVIANRIGWVRSKTPDETAEQLQRLLPREFWGVVNPLLVGFGQQICRSRGPRCECCLLREGLCPYYRDVVCKQQAKSSKRGRKKVSPSASVASASASMSSTASLAPRRRPLKAAPKRRARRRTGDIEDSDSISEGGGESTYDEDEDEDEDDEDDEESDYVDSLLTLDSESKNPDAPPARSQKRPPTDEKHDASATEDESAPEEPPEETDEKGIKTEIPLKRARRRTSSTM